MNDKQVMKESYDEIVASICFDIATDVHRMASTKGKSTLTDVMIKMIGSVKDLTNTKRCRLASSSSTNFSEEALVHKESLNSNKRHCKPTGNCDDTATTKKVDVNTEISDEDKLNPKKIEAHDETQVPKHNDDQAQELASDMKEDPKLTTTTNQPTNRSNVTNRNPNLDVWNRISSKDVTLSCSNCGKFVGVKRFALHLDRCRKN